MLRLFVVTFLFLAIFPAAKPALGAQIEAGARVDADLAVREALRSNHDLQVVRLAIAVARGQRLQAGRLANPEFYAAASDDSFFGSEGERAQEIGLSQSFPITARLARERDVARSDVRIAEAEVGEFARRLVADTLGTFYALVSLDRQIEVNDELIASVRQVERATAGRLKAAEVSPAEVSLLRIERLRLELGSRRLALERDTTQGRLARLMGRGGSQPLYPVGELDPGPDASASLLELLAVARARRPDLSLAQLEIERAEAAHALARAETWRDWVVEVSYDRERQVFETPIENKQDSLLRVGLTVPLPLWNRQQGRIAAAEARVRRARRAVEALELRVGEEVRSALARLRALRVGVDEYARELLLESARTRELLERGYQQGLVGIAELIQVQRQDNEARMDYLALLGDLRQASIDLEVAAANGPYLPDSFPQGETP